MSEELSFRYPSLMIDRKVGISSCHLVKEPAWEAYVMAYSNLLSICTEGAPVPRELNDATWNPNSIPVKPTISDLEDILDAAAVDQLEPIQVVFEGTRVAVRGTGEPWRFEYGIHQDHATAAACLVYAMHHCRASLDSEGQQSQRHLLYAGMLRGFACGLPYVGKHLARELRHAVAVTGRKNEDRDRAIVAEVAKLRKGGKKAYIAWRMVGDKHGIREDRVKQICRQARRNNS